MKQLYLKNNLILTPEIEKVPQLKNWQNSEFNKLEEYDDSYNFGLVVQKDQLIIDVDKQNGGIENYEKLKADLNISLKPTVNTPSGGFHIYLQINEDKKLKKNLEKYEGIDFLTKGSKATIAGSKSSKGVYKFANKNLQLFWQECPQILLDELEYKQTVYDLNDTNIGGNKNNTTKEDLERMLSNLDSDMTYKEWIKIGMALKRWDAKIGLELWENWSKTGKKYEQGLTDTRWATFDQDSGDGKVTTATIYNKYKTRILENIEANIVNAKTSDEIDIEINNLKQYKLGHSQKNNYTRLIQSKNLLINNEKLDFLKLRTSLTLKVEEKPIKKPKDKKPTKAELLQDLLINGTKWYNDWVYLVSHSAFCNIKTFDIYKTEAFNLMNTHNLLKDGKVNITASKFVMNYGLIKTLGTLAYLPTEEGLICNFNGKQVLNTFDRSSLPKPAKDYTECGKKAIEMVKNHTRLICNYDEKDYNILIQFIAHNVQFMGKKILWCPIIQGVPGIGKSFYSELFSLMLGSDNVGTIKTTQVVDNNNGWAMGRCVNILEELRIAGKNRHEAVNAIKPLITDKTIHITEKYVKQFNTLNTTNYISFTNYKDAIPLNNTDRRWWVVYCDVENLEHLSKLVGESHISYFPKLFKSLQENSAEILKWLLEYDISDKFKKTHQAPMTKHKMSAIATEASSLEYLEEVSKMLEDKGVYYSNLCVSSADLYDDAKVLITGFSEVKRSLIILILKKLGFMRHAKIMNIDGKTRTIWTKKTLTDDDVKTEFKNLKNLKINTKNT